MDWKEILWETTKAFGPAIVAWFLAVWTSKRNSKNDKEKMLEQLELTKRNNIEAQNQSYKLQFCLSELEKKDILFEELISELNIVGESTARFRNPHMNERNIEVIGAANSALKQLHLVMFNTGTLSSIIKAANADFKKYQNILENLQSQGTSVEATLHFLCVGIEHPMSEQEFDSNYDNNVLLNFIKGLIEMQEFIIETINKIFNEMGDNSAEQK